MLSSFCPEDQRELFKHKWVLTIAPNHREQSETGFKVLQLGLKFFEILQILQLATPSYPDCSAKLEI